MTPEPVRRLSRLSQLSRLNLVVEGQTELGFFNLVLKEHLAARGIFASARCVETSRRGAYVFRGGVLDYQRVRRDLTRWMKQEPGSDTWFSTMLDMYRLPGDFPGRSGQEDARLPDDAYQRVRYLEQAFGRDIDHRRFIPYIQLHEFEALLFTDVSRFDWEFVDDDAAIRRLAGIAARFDSPEAIDGGDSTAPSKRIIREIPAYKRRKASAGPLIASKIGLDRLRASCRHFDEWLSSLEQLAMEPVIESS